MTARPDGQAGRGWGDRIRGWFTPGRDWGMGAALLLGLTALGVWLWGTLPKLNPAAPGASAKIALLDVLMALAISGVVMFLVRRVVRLPGLFLWMLGFFALLMLGTGAGPSSKGWYLTVALLAVAATLIGGLLWRFLHGDQRGWGTGLGLLLGLAIVVGGGAWLLWPGASAPAIADAASASAPLALDGVADPSQRGEFAVQTLTYGSGTDRNRPEFGAEATLKTASVDGSAFIGGWAGPSDRTAFWGFDATALPLNGRVWYPESDGPFPLVLVVHGNGRADAYSDGGFAYLGELLASRGYIVASVDENFLNTSIFDRAAGLTGATPARGWLLLEHLRLWHEWNAAAGNPFAGKVDTDAIALMGHSRGGEAVVIAAAFNRMSHYPDDAAVAFDYGYAIRSLVALAPSDGLYLPGGQPLGLENINYLALQGSHDADVGTFAGLNHYDRLTFTDGGDWMKSAIYIYRANHSQFNSSWDRYDLGEGLSARFFDTATLLPAAEQQNIAQTFVAAFLDATLKGMTAYRPLFHDPRTGRDWLPETIYLRQYADSHAQAISTFEEDTDPTTTTVAGGVQEGDGLATWEEMRLPRRRGESVNHAVHLVGGPQAATGSYRITLPSQGITLTPTSRLRFDMAFLGWGDMAGNDPTRGADLDIELTDANGNTAALPLSHVSLLQSPIPGQYLKAAFLQGEPLTEPLLQTFDFALADFAAVNSAFDPTTLTTIAVTPPASGGHGYLLDNVVITTE